MSKNKPTVDKLKSTEEEPATHHILKCKVCKKESKESLKYHYACTRCRLNNNFYRASNEIQWQSWGYEV